MQILAFKLRVSQKGLFDEKWLFKSDNIGKV